jgi:hypothetical protein
LFQFDYVAGKVLTLVPLEVDLVSHFCFFVGGEFYLAPDVVNKGSCRVLGVSSVFVVGFSEVLGIDSAHDAFL